MSGRLRNETQATPKFSFFSLNRLKSHCYYPPTNVDFSSNPSSRIPNHSLLPVFNHDLQYYTPTFILSNEKPNSQEQLRTQQLKFREKILAEEIPLQQSNNQSFQCCLTSSETKFCQVCNQKFEDYWQHMQDRTHQRKIMKNAFNVDIEQLCGLFQPNPSQQLKKQKTMKRSKESTKALARCHSQIMKLGIGNHSTQIIAEGCPL